MSPQQVGLRTGTDPRHLFLTKGLLTADALNPFLQQQLLLDNVFNTMLPNQLKRWLLVYMIGRKPYVELKEFKSNRRLAKQGVPQGGVLSPNLFNLYLLTFFAITTCYRSWPQLICGAIRHELLQLGANFGYPAFLDSHQPGSDSKTLRTGLELSIRAT